MRFCCLALLLLASCTAIEQPDFHARKSSRVLVNWRHGSDSLTADVTIQESESGALRLLISKGTTLLVLAQAGQEWTATGPLARGGWHGNAAGAPAPLSSWICFAQAARGKTSAFHVECGATGDRFRAVF